ncbi:hypothetical protein ACFUN8_32990 [Streptomyces sp. NPDC057307]|uniref:hypothetical protein n=1 Tax=Streptomyces sp. NPDC057307 TaxID=3346096 RepID=UPI00363181FB
MSVSTILLILLILWLLSRHDKRKAAARRAKRKAEIAAIVKSRPEDADLFIEVLDEVKAKDAKGKPS